MGKQDERDLRAGCDIRRGAGAEQRVINGEVRLTQHWAVTVERNGEGVVTIESNCLSGRDISPEDERVIRDCAYHLLAFIGDPHPKAGASNVSR